MQLEVDPGQSVQQVASSRELSHPWILGLVAVDDGPHGSHTPAMRPYSYRSECECPDDCLRDHENE